ncbi:hypothetical protein T12_5705, partial [Trichinella patagoniensis]
LRIQYGQTSLFCSQNGEAYLLVHEILILIRKSFKQLI